MVGIAADGLSKARDSLVPAAEPEERPAEMVMGVGRIRREGQRAPQGRDGLVETALNRQHRPQVDMSLGEVGSRGEGAAIAGFRLPVPPTAEMDRTQQVPGSGILRIGPEDPAAGLIRLGMPARTVVLPADSSACPSARPSLPLLPVTIDRAVIFHQSTPSPQVDTIRVLQHNILDENEPGGDNPT